MAKVVYVAHPIGGNVEQNISSVKKICSFLHSSDVIPFAPYLQSLEYLDDSNKDDRKLGVDANYEFLQRGFIDEIGLFGSHISRGMFGELELGLNESIPLVPYDSGPSVELPYALEGLERGIVLPKYLDSQSELSSGDALFFRRDESPDIVLFDARKIIDSFSGMDVTRFLAQPNLWDEIPQGYTYLEENGISPKLAYASLTDMYSDGKDLDLSLIS